MLTLVAITLCLTGAFYVAATLLFWPDIAPWRRSRGIQRRRRYVGTHTYALALRCGFRYSYVRDALVLRRVGRRWGPVLKLRVEPASERLPPRVADRSPPRRVAAGSPPPARGAGTAPPARAAPPLGRDASRPPASERVPSRTQRVVEITCLPLPHLHRTQRLWQLTAVDTEVRFVWVEVKRTRGDPPSADDAAGFVRRIAADLAALGLHLDAIVIRAGGTHRRSVSDAAVAAAGVRLLRIPPGMRHERIAAHTHDRIAAAYWRNAFARDAGRSMDALRRGLRSWVDAHNSAPPPHDAAALPPASALLAHANPLLAAAHPPAVDTDAGDP
jgi:hypothetical protein